MDSSVVQGLKCWASRSSIWLADKRQLLWSLVSSSVKPALQTGLPCWLSGKESARPTEATGDARSIPGSGRPPGGGQGNPLQCSCLENAMDRGAWRATVHGVADSWTHWSNWGRGQRRSGRGFLFLVCLPSWRPGGHSLWWFHSPSFSQSLLEPC